MKRWQQCFQELCVIFVVPWKTANISSYIEWTRANVGISLTFLQLTCVFCCKYICSFKLKFLLKNCLRGIKMKYILCERAWSQCIMGNTKIAENVLKNYWDGIFCNVIIFYCFLELLETPTVFFKKILILGQCYTFVHQNSATDHNKTSIRFGFCDIRNNQGRGKCYQPKPKAEADNTNRDLDYSGYHKNLIQ